MKKLATALSTYFDWFYLPDITVSDIIEIIILSYLIYHVMLWFKKTRAWTLFKGIVVIAVFMCLAAVFQLNTILWIIKNLKPKDLRILLYSVTSYHIKTFHLVQRSRNYRKHGDRTWK